MPGWISYKLESRQVGETLTISDDTTLMAESKEELKNLLMRVKEGSEKADLKINIKKKLRSWHPAPSLHSKQQGEKSK